MFSFFLISAYEDRIDLLSVMIEGPKKTPYEDGMFLFDIQLGKEYPRTPPSCLYISYCSDRLNPNLYENGKVCISLLGTWAGRGSEVWGPGSTLLQVIVSIQGLILVAEPYFNEAGYEKQKGLYILLEGLIINLKICPTVRQFNITRKFHRIELYQILPHYIYTLDRNGVV